MFSIPRLPHRATRFLLLFGVILISAATTQCKMVTDSAVRPQVEPSGAGACIKACADEANEAIRIESELHVKNVKACSDNSCKSAEARRHEAAVQAIQARRKACQNGCHHQGGGNGR
jgi:hypothetical protein